MESPISHNVNQNLPSNLLCLSHLRWDFVYQRPQHILTRFSKYTNVYFFEEPIYMDIAKPVLNSSPRTDSLIVLTPHLPHGSNADVTVKNLVDSFFIQKDINDFTVWYYTPMALKFSEHLQPAITVYDCMDELSAFKFAPAELKDLEFNLLKKADIVFTGGHSLYQAKKHTHKNIFPFPSSIDQEHFGQARLADFSPLDQKTLSWPRIGFYGVIDERFDIDLIAGIAEARPEWQIILIGPVVKINPDTLPRNKNIHYLGSKNYEQLPAYLSGWDVALIPFMINESTKFISPTKTPEYLAAGVPVVSTAIADVVKPYGDKNLVEIASDAKGFVNAIEKSLSINQKEWLPRVDAFLKENSWDITCNTMLKHISAIAEKNTQLTL